MGRICANATDFAHFACYSILDHAILNGAYVAEVLVPWLVLCALVRFMCDGLLDGYWFV